MVNVVNGWDKCKMSLNNEIYARNFRLDTRINFIIFLTIQLCVIKWIMNGSRAFG